MKTQNLKALIVLGLVLSFTACKKNDSVPEALKAEDRIDVSYGEHEQNSMDVYLPAGRTDTTKVIILLHGGGWSKGDKDSLTQYAMHFRDSGFAVVNMNYRLAGTPEGNIHPAQQHDITTAINFISSKAIDWHISKDKFGLAGVSAGAHLALLYTYAYNTHGKIRTVVSLAGPTNFTETQGTGPSQAAAVQIFIGSDFSTNLEKYIEASPLARASSLSKPTLIFHGSLDRTVPLKQSQDLHVS